MNRAGNKFVRKFSSELEVDDGVHDVPAVPLHGGEGDHDNADDTEADTVGKEREIWNSFLRLSIADRYR